MLRHLRPAVLVLLSLSVITGVVYPLLMTGVASVLFPSQAAGSLVVKEGKVVGSALIGQHFSEPKYFWGRPSATAPFANNALASGGSNLGPLNPALIDAVKQRVDALKAADPDNVQKIPVDLVTASGSGLDPDISLAAAQYQLNRVARVRHLEVAKVQVLLEQYARYPMLGFLGTPRVNVLELNMALDEVR
ncbi:MAG TPA: potassium-transporting ATPase subunit KdpC [Steroidobacteraceae bacterium]|nr:potassium-transporting ATPase subunit KdpC [Steroidobacteraceae bacterium]